jgi:serine/threonine protein phosphatase PrpC
VLEDTIVEEDIHPRYVCAALTDKGRLRTTNQDAFLDLTASGLWVVADGMGGYRDGDVASRMVCEALQSVVPGETFETTIDDIRQRISDVNQRLYRAATRRIDPIVSGSTVAMFLARRTTCAALWAGDSRVYRLRYRRLVQITTDHTWAAELNLQQPTDEADHAITRAVGGEELLLLDVRRDRVRLGDRYLICSDGLTRELRDEQLAALLGQGDVHTSAHALLEATLAAGARDNVTVVVIDAL